MAKDIVAHSNLTVPFEVFRYQLVVDKVLPINMFEKYETADQVRADKNNILQKVLTGNDFNFRGGTSELTSKFMYSDGTMIYYRLGVRRSATLYDKNFRHTVQKIIPTLL